MANASDPSPFDDYDYGIESFQNEDWGFGDANGQVKPSSRQDAPTIILAGQPRAGKSSIQRVVFQKMSPNETLFLQSTHKVVRHALCLGSFINFNILDTPGDTDFEDPQHESVFQTCGALIYVINAQELDLQESLTKLINLINRAYDVNPRIIFKVFIHKVDGLAEDQQIEVQRGIQQQITEELREAQLEDVHPTLYLTSIYDHSIFEAFSKVVQTLIPELPTLERILDLLTVHCRMEKAYLVDSVSRIYICTDSSPTDMKTYELCSDMIDVVVDVSCIYGEGDEPHEVPETQEAQSSDADCTHSIIKLANGSSLYLQQINKYLALVCFFGKRDKLDKQGLIAYNVSCFKKAIQKVFNVAEDTRKQQKMRKGLL